MSHLRACFPLPNSQHAPVNVSAVCTCKHGNLNLNLATETVVDYGVGVRGSGLPSNHLWVCVCSKYFRWAWYDHPPNLLPGWSCQRPSWQETILSPSGGASCCFAGTWNIFDLQTPANGPHVDLLVVFKNTWYGVECRLSLALWMKPSHSAGLKKSRKIAIWGSLLSSSYLKGPILR